MANLQPHRAHESLNVDTAAGWDVQTAQTAAVTGGTEVQWDVSSFNQIGIYSASTDIRFTFATATGATINDNNDLILPAQTLTFLKVPKALGSTVYFVTTSATSATSLVKIIGM